MYSLRSLFQILFPDTCISCSKVGTIVCAPCLQKLTPSSQLPEPNNKYSVSVFSYKDKVVHELVWQLKYKNRQDIASIVGEFMHSTISSYLEDVLGMYPHKKIILIPVPLHISRERSRGYNQSNTLAHAIQQYSERYVVKEVLTRVKNTTPHAKSHSKKERTQNIKNAFRVNEKMFSKDSLYVLIDDVITSGSTVDEARRTLMQAGAQNIFVLSLAH